MTTEAPLKTVLRKINAHRNACSMSEDTLVQETWASIEDYLSRLIECGVKVEKEKEMNNKINTSTEGPGVSNKIDTSTEAVESHCSTIAYHFNVDRSKPHLKSSSTF